MDITFIIYCRLENSPTATSKLTALYKQGLGINQYLDKAQCRHPWAPNSDKANFHMHAYKLSPPLITGWKITHWTSAKPAK